jgi:hypothetical protein
MKTIAHHRQKQVPLPRDKAQTIQIIVIIKELWTTDNSRALIL